MMKKIHTAFLYQILPISFERLYPIRMYKKSYTCSTNNSWDIRKNKKCIKINELNKNIKLIFI